MNFSDSNPYLVTNTSMVVNSYNNVNYMLVKDVRDWLFNRKRHNDTPNMAVLPVLAILVFIVCALLKVYKWYKDGERLKNRGDVEFGDESEVNYGIIKAGDKNFCNVEIRSDTTSVYDTVTSFRHMGNGYAVGGGGGTYNYHDTVTSYKSLLMQRLDGAQYDSVKSYKAFLRQVTQNTDLAVDVKLLDNYPVRSKSAEHCVLEEESSGIISEAVKPLSVADVKVTIDCKKKSRHRKASGDNWAMRKRSCSNPTYHSSRTGAASLPSIHHTLSSDSSNDDDAFVTLASDRRKLWENRKKMVRSCSGGKLAKGSPSQNGDLSSDIPYFPTRRRHFSADSVRRPRKPLGSLCHRADLVDLRESISETDPRPEDIVLLKKHEESSSDNPDSSPTSCSTSVSSDAIESESEDEETQQITQISIASDDHTVSCDGVFDSCGELNSSAEHLLGPNRHLNESMNGICNLPLEPIDQGGETSASPSFVSALPITISSRSKTEHKKREETSHDISASAANKKENHSTFTGIGEGIIIQENTQHNSPSSSSSNLVSNSNSVSSNPPSPSVSHSGVGDFIEPKSDNTESPSSANLRRIKRFHVTFVSSDVSSPNSD